MEQAFDIVGVKYPILESVKVGSGEGLAELLKDADGQNRLLFPDEISHLLEKANMDRASLAYILNSSFYRDRDRLVTKGKSIDYNARLSISGGTTTNLFYESFGFKTADGLYDRFLFGMCPEPFTFHYEPPDCTPEKISPQRVEVSHDVWEAKTEWLKEGIAPRVAELALRVAYICACVDHRVLQAMDLTPAFEFAKYQTQIRNILQPSPAERDGAKIEFAVRRFMSAVPDGKWVNRSELYKKAHAERFGIAKFESSLGWMCSTGELEVKKIGGKQVCYRAKKEA